MRQIGIGAESLLVHRELRGNQLKGFYPGYDRENHEGYVYRLGREESP